MDVVAKKLLEIIAAVRHTLLDTYLLLDSQTENHTACT